MPSYNKSLKAMGEGVYYFSTCLKLGKKRELIIAYHDVNISQRQMGMIGNLFYLLLYKLKIGNNMVPYILDRKEVTIVSLPPDPRIATCRS